MPGSVNHLRQYTSSYYTPFRFYANSGVTLQNAPILDLHSSESANRNEIIVLPFKTTNTIATTNTYVGTSGDTCTVQVYGLINLESATDTVIGDAGTWVQLMSIDLADGVMSSISPLFATYYKLIPTTAGYTLNISNNDVNMNGGQPSMIQETFPKVAWGGVIGQPIASTPPSQNLTSSLSISTAAGTINVTDF